MLKLLWMKIHKSVRTVFSYESLCARVRYIKKVNSRRSRLSPIVESHWCFLQRNDNEFIDLLLYSYNLLVGELPPNKLELLCESCSISLSGKFTNGDAVRIVILSEETAEARNELSSVKVSQESFLGCNLILMSLLEYC